MLAACSSSLIWTLEYLFSFAVTNFYTPILRHFIYYEILIIYFLPDDRITMGGWLEGRMEILRVGRVDDASSSPVSRRDWEEEGNFLDANIYKCKYSFHILSIKFINDMEVLQNTSAILLWLMH